MPVNAFSQYAMRVRYAPLFPRQINIRSTSSRLISSRRRSQSLVVRVLAWLTIAAAFSSVPPLLRYAVMPEAVIAYPGLGVCRSAIDVT